MKIILVKKHWNIYKNENEYNNLFRVVSDGFEGVNPGDVMKNRNLTVEEIHSLSELLDGEEEVESLEDLINGAFDEDLEAAAEALGIPVYSEMPWEVYFPGEE